MNKNLVRKYNINAILNFKNL